LNRPWRLGSSIKNFIEPGFIDYLGSYRQIHKKVIAMAWETVIGLEIHAQLATRSKIFSGASTAYGAAPNTQACAIDLGLPGVLPVLNREAVRMAVMFGLAIDASVARRSIFARKNYFYPDLPKGYQISQYELPIVHHGQLTIDLEDGGSKVIGITRAHLEEDAGKSLHEDFHGMTGVDLNRAGTPLLEIVSEPDLRSPGEAVAYMKKLHTLVRYLGICDGNMQEGSFRCDANVSVRPEGQAAFGTRTEIKNLNSFRFVERAIEFEVQRQIEVLEDGGQVVQETRLYDPDKGETRAMRSKEEANDYRYFPDPDLLPLVLEEAFIENARTALPELPDAKKQRFMSEYGLNTYDAGVLTASRELADYYETVVAALGGEPKLCANWVMGDLAAALNKSTLDITQSPVSASLLAGLLKRIQDRTLSGKLAKEVFEALWNGEGEADAIIARRGLQQITDMAAIEQAIDAVFQAHPEQLAQYRAGKDKLLGFFVGQVMKVTQGKANPQQLNELLVKKLKG
jgi:aspartyl-tRNA(Asn)/glutamyl-tRNA(Gln) amidotransferase subunit B